MLEGTVRRFGGRVRVAVQLTDAEKDALVWAERYDRVLDDTFALEDEIAAQAPPIPLPARVTLVMAVFAVLSGVAWRAHRAASVIRYAVRQHDVIVRTGVFWRNETVQPITRIQHVEQVQGPLDKRLGLSTLRLYSAGTGHATFRIPGLDTAVAARISAFILDFADQEDGGEDEAPLTADGSERSADD